MKSQLLILACSTMLLAACDERDNAADIASDKMEAAAEASAIAAGPAVAALGLTEAQLLDADLRDRNGVELGDVAQVLRGADGKVDRLLIEIEDSNPDRFVHVPISGLATVVRGAETDLSTTMTKEQLAALPAVKLPAS
jgi:hypothetical protein